MDEQDKKEYELAVLVKNEDDLAPVAALARQHGAEIATEFRAKRLTLAYEIKKNKEAVFAYCTFKAEGPATKELEADLNTKAEVIRFLIVKAPAPDTSSRQASPLGAAAVQRRGRTMRTPGAPEATKPAVPKSLSNEALEKKIEEILQ